MKADDLTFICDEYFELDLVGNRQLDLLIYSWDSQNHLKLCYKSSFQLATLLKGYHFRELSFEIESKGTLYLRLKYTDENETFQRGRHSITSLASRAIPLFGVDIETIVSSKTMHEFRILVYITFGNKTFVYSKIDLFLGKK